VIGNPGLTASGVHDNIFDNNISAEIERWPSARIVRAAPVDGPPPPRHGAMLEGQVTVGWHRMWAFAVAFVAMVVAGDVGAQPDAGADAAASTEGRADLDHDSDCDPRGTDRCTDALRSPNKMSDADGGASDDSTEPSETKDGADLSKVCRTSRECGERGLCSAVDGQCAAVRDADCRRSLLCALGRCTARNGECVVASDADCAESKACREKGWCTAKYGRCVRDFTRDGPAERRARGTPTGFGPDADMEIRSPAMLGVGIATVAVGGVGVLFGFGALFTAGFAAIGAEVGSSEARTTRDTALIVAASAGGGGAVLTPMGVMLIVRGAKRVPSANRAEALPSSLASPTVSIGPTGGSLTWRF
jgi:hypothetical protein